MKTTIHEVKTGAGSDISVLWTIESDISLESAIYADGTYNCFELEDILKVE